MENIFRGSSLQARFAYEFYTRLLTREPVSYADILSSFIGEDISCKKISIMKGYGELKKAVSAVQKKLKQKDNKCIKTTVIKGVRTYCYVGPDANPLAEEEFAAKQASLDDFVKFCKSSIGFLPDGWLSSFFDNANILSNASNDIINSSITQDLKNIELLGDLYKAITEKKVISFSYHPFYKDREETITFHPQFLKEYNQRWFLFGQDKDKDKYPCNIALDRIEGDIRPMEEEKYIPAEPNFYHDYFENIVGVTHEKDTQIEHIVIRTLTKYQHGLIITKPFHHTQKETKPFNGTYGEISLYVRPNKEFIGRILTFGENLEVIEPSSLRDRIHHILLKQIKLYEK